MDRQGLAIAVPGFASLLEREERIPLNGQTRASDIALGERGAEPSIRSVLFFSTSSRFLVALRLDHGHFLFGLAAVLSADPML